MELGLPQLSKTRLRKTCPQLPTQGTEICHPGELHTLTIKRQQNQVAEC